MAGLGSGDVFLSNPDGLFNKSDRLQYLGAYNFLDGVLGTGAEQRFSMMNFAGGPTLPIPAVDGDFDQGDRQHFLDLYSEILSDPPGSHIRRMRISRQHKKRLRIEV